MKRPTRINSTIFGAFLSLILNSSPKPQPSSENLSDVASGARTSPISVLWREEAIAETQRGDVRQRMLRPFASLIST